MGQKGPQHRYLIGQRGKGVLSQVGILCFGILMVKPAHAQLFQLIAAVGRSQQIGGDSGIKDKAAPLDSLV